MRAVVQRVSRAACRVDGKTVGAVGLGLVVLLAVGRDDTDTDLELLAGKIVNLRVFEDSDGKMNLALQQVGGGVLLISQFTLYGDVRKGNRPSFGEAAPADAALHYYRRMAERLALEVPVETGQFQAMMEVELVNTGPVTILLDSRKTF